MIRRGADVELESQTSLYEYFSEDDSEGENGDTDDDLEHMTETNFDLWYFSNVNLK